MRYLAILAVWAAVFFGASAEAQQTIIVQNCGQLSPQYTVGVQGRATAIVITTTANGTATAVNVNSSGYQQ